MVNLKDKTVIIKYYDIYLNCTYEILQFILSWTKNQFKIFYNRYKRRKIKVYKFIHLNSAGILLNIFRAKSHWDFASNCNYYKKRMVYGFFLFVVCAHIFFTCCWSWVDQWWCAGCSCPAHLINTQRLSSNL